MSKAAAFRAPVCISTAMAADSCKRLRCIELKWFRRAPVVPWVVRAGREHRLKAKGRTLRKLHLRHCAAGKSDAPACAERVFKSLGVNVAARLTAFPDVKTR